MRNLEKVEAPKPVETFAIVLAYLALFKDIPEICRGVFISKVVPESVKTFLLGAIANRAFWYRLSFTVVLLAVYLWLFRKKVTKKSIDKDPKDKVIAALHRYRIVRNIRSLGLVPLREWLLDLMKVGLYGTFSRAKQRWPADADRFDSVDRITFTDGSGFEAQYAKDFSSIFLRTHPANSDQYGNSVSRLPSKAEMKVLLLASNFFPFWLVIHRCRRLLLRIA